MNCSSSTLNLGIWEDHKGRRKNEREETGKVQMLEKEKKESEREKKTRKSLLISSVMSLFSIWLYKTMHINKLCVNEQGAKM